MSSEYQSDEEDDDLYEPENDTAKQDSTILTSTPSTPSNKKTQSTTIDYKDRVFLIYDKHSTINDTQHTAATTSTTASAKSLNHSNPKAPDIPSRLTNDNDKNNSNDNNSDLSRFASHIITTLPNPRNGDKAKYMINKTKDSKVILEIQRMCDDPSSWFIDNTVHKDGSLYVCSPIDPLFLSLPLLEKSRKKTASHAGFFCTQAQIFMEADPIFGRGLAHLRSIVSPDTLSFICDTKEIESDQTVLFRLNDEKVLAWLKSKVGRLAEKIKEPSFSVMFGSTRVSTFTLSAAQGGGNERKIGKDEILQLALGFVSEYVSNDWVSKVGKECGIEGYQPPTGTRIEQVTPMKQPLSHDSILIGDLIDEALEGEKKSSASKRKEPTEKEKKLAHSAKGTPNISSFFAKKPKLDEEKK